VVGTRQMFHGIPQRLLCVQVEGLAMIALMPGRLCFEPRLPECLSFFGQKIGFCGHGDAHGGV
jgi:hypothetical protein